MNSNESNKLVLDTIERYGFIKTNNNNAKLDLKYTNCSVSIFCYDNICNLSFNEIRIKMAKVEYDMTKKEDIRKIMTRARNIAKKATKLEKIEIDDDSKHLTKYKVILKALLDNQIAFAFNISRAYKSSAALVEVNGFKIRVNDESLTTRISIGAVYDTVPVTLAMQMINLLPKK